MNKAKSLKRALETAEEYISRAAQRGREADPSPVLSTVADNAYYYIRKLRETRLQLKFFKKLPSRDGIPYAFRALWSHFKEEGFEYREDTPQSALKDYDCGSLEVDMLKSLILAAALVETGLACKAALADGSGGARLQKALKLMKTVEVNDFSHIYPKLSAAERRLSERAAGYMSMTDSTKAMYRKALRRYSAKRGLSEKDGVLRAEEKAQATGLPLGAVLGVDKKPKPHLYLLTAGVVFGLLLWAFCLLCPLWALPLLFLPLGAFALGFSDFCFSILSTPKPCPAIASDKLPAGKYTLTVITTLLDGDEGIFDRLEQLYHTNRGGGMLFGVLADLPSAKTPTAPKDKELINQALAALESLENRFGNSFCLFIRGRRENGEGLFCGRERKRGAIEDLVRYIKGTGNAFTVAAGADCRGASYLLTLDGDTRLPPDGVKTLTGMMLHPLNRPVIKNGKIKRGYGIIQPAVKPCLCTKGNTGFSTLLTGAGGIDVYESAAFNRQQNVFGEGIFCGKGIIDIDAYSRLLESALPVGRVLSHDLPEGNILRTRYVSDLSFTDSVPSGVLSYFSRLHRWVRGDTQNLSLLSGYNQRLRGGTRIVMNVLRHLCPVLSLAALFAAGFLVGEPAGLWLCLFALANTVSPLLYTLLSRPKALRFKSRRFFSGVKGGLVQSLRTVFYELCSLCHKAVITIDAILKAVFRLIRGKKLLKWVTFAQTEKMGGDGIVLYVYRCFPGAVLGGVAFFMTELWATRLLGLFWFLYPVFAYRLSCPVRERPAVRQEHRRLIKERALPMWRFFEDNVNASTCWLPPDNIQLSPVEAKALRTSPTNMGLYLLSVAAAEDFGFISGADAEARIDKALATIQSLPKWRGHLYNWYSLNPCAVIGGAYVSTVDSGNFCVCAVALSRYLHSHGRADLARRAEQLFRNADFKSLYNGKRKLFALGAEGETNKLSDICYDLYISEARTTSYFAVATGKIPSEHWKALGRPVVESGGYIGMASWSGTAFEYFMPQLFLPIYKDSFVYESLCYALYQQRRLARGRLWGISESAYLAFDGEMNYQYKAHGVQGLALSRYSENELVLSPYSVYLTMCIAPKSALRTLAAYDRAGMKGRYGHYEAMDFSAHNGQGTPIYSYMAHHVGMSLIACANACFDGVFVRRFMDYPQNAAFYELLQERIPVGALIYSAEKQTGLKKATSVRGGYRERLSDCDPADPIIHVGGNGANTIVADSVGHVRFSHGGLTVNETDFDPYTCIKSFNVAFTAGKEVFYATPDGGEGKHSFESTPSYAAHICASPRFSGRVKYYTDPTGSFVAETKSDMGKSYALVFSFDPQLSTDREFYAHPAFNRLFISAEYDKSLGALIYSKNSRDGREVCYMAVGLHRADIPISFETNKESYPAFSLRQPRDVLKESYTCTTGVCVSPFCLIKTPPLAGGHSRLIISLGHSRRECCERLSASRKMGEQAVGKAVAGDRENPLLQGLFYGKCGFAKTNTADERSLWSFGVSGDFPIVAVSLEEENVETAKEYLSIFLNLAALNIRFDLVFLIKEEDTYQAPLRNRLQQLIQRVRCQGFVGKRGGIFFANGRDSKTVSLFKESSVCYVGSDGSSDRSVPRTALAPLPQVIRSHCFSQAVSGKPVGGGAYDGEGFTVDKDKAQLLPFSYVLAGKGLGAVVTQSTLGYSFYGNAALCKIAAFKGDPHGGTDRGEVAYAFLNGKIYDLAACAATVRYEAGVVVYQGELEGKPYKMEVFVCHLLPIKAIRLSTEEELDSALSLLPSMGGVGNLTLDTFQFEGGGGLFFENPKNSFYSGALGFVAGVGSTRTHKSIRELFCGTPVGEDVAALSLWGRSAVFLIGAAPSERGVKEVCALFAKRGFEAEKEDARRFAYSFLPPVSLKGENALSAMFNTFAPYQVAACRFYARGAFYQSGGAFGFRDQLQDCLFLLYSKPHTVRCHILRAAARQYTDGSVQHWWHPRKRWGQVYGIKSRCSDDFMWFPIAVAEYVEKTGDRSILAERVPYIQSPPLGKEKERYEGAEPTEYRESIEDHCRRALEHGNRLGIHGLPLMGSCDWNDAFSDLGEGAESVFSAFLYVIALNKFAATVGDPDLKTQAAALLSSAENAFCADRYIRAYDGNGTPLGVDGRRACEIDALVQAFAVFAGADKARCKTAMETAYNRLYDRENRLLKLFTPAFGRDTEYAGYINAYAKGIRENGGQYTHAAIWFAAALAKCGMVEEGLQLINDINPLKRSEDSALYAKYKGEPYAIAADIYTAKGQTGRMGWSHYTGAAAWYCKTVLEVFMGIRIEGFCRLAAVKPLMKYTATLKFKGTLTVRAYKDAPLSYDGKPALFPLPLEEGEHILTVPLWDGGADNK